MQALNTLVWTAKHSVAYMGCSITLTARQREVLLLLCEGLPNKLISRRLAISDATVKSHVASVLRSLNASTRLEAVILAFRLGLVETTQPQSASGTREADRQRYATPLSTKAQAVLVA